MTTDIFDNPDAFEPMLEEFIWRQKKSPKATAVVKGCLFHGRKEIEAYSSMSGVIKRYSDTWTMTVPLGQTVAAKMAMGDEVERMGGDRQKLTVQNVIKEDGEWIVSVTSSQAISVAV